MTFKRGKYYVYAFGKLTLVDGFVNILEGIGIRKADGYWQGTDLMTGLRYVEMPTKKYIVDYDLSRLHELRKTQAYAEQCKKFYDLLPPPEYVPKYETLEEQQEREARKPVNGRG
jgi:hypothetical protein